MPLTSALRALLSPALGQRPAQTLGPCGSSRQQEPYPKPHHGLLSGTGAVVPLLHTGRDGLLSTMPGGLWKVVLGSQGLWGQLVTVIYTVP